MATASNGRLVFKHPFTGSARLVCGRSTGPVVETYELAGHIALPDPVIGGELRNAWPVAGHIALPAPVFSGALLYDVNVSRGPAAGTVARWQDAGAADRPLQSHWQDATRVQASAADHAQDALLVDAATRDRFQDTQRRSTAARQHWQDADTLDTVLRDAFQYAEQRSSSTAQHWQDARAIDRATRDRFQDMLVRRGGVLQRFQQADLRVASFGQWGGYALPIWSGNTQHWQDARQPPPGQHVLHPPIDPPHLCYDPATLGRLVFRRPFTSSGRLVFICHRHIDPPDPGGTVIVPVRRVYVTINTITLRRVDGDLPIPCEAFQMQLDEGSWTWSWSCTVRQASLAALAPARAGEPVLVEATINGVPYRLQVEALKRDRKFGELRVGVSGRGIAAVLDAPYAPTLNFGNLADRTAQQLMVDALTDNGVPIGWDVDWGLADWLVPAGAWSHSGSYISAINAIAAAAGGYVQPHNTAQTLRILHRYPVAPWDWGSLVPDVELPQDVVEVEGTEWLAKPAYNRVFASGAAQGVLGQVTRGGTAGNLVAPMVTDALITHADAARQRGRAVLADTGPQAMVSMSLPVLAETGIILPGTFVRRVDAANGETLQGYVRGVSVSQEWPRLRQTIEVQCHA